ncbi:MAG: ATP-dependent sacrificial sulfur transferase LarE [Thermodesulfobacteriota bacterium]|nr:ATP-dependent sacrificial sulfur transferase LarE [Thermodesulfobacteriota bacterium]
MDKFKQLVRILKEFQSVAVAFSGGVDSMFLAAVAKTKSCIDVVAVTVVSEFMSGKDIEHAQRMADQLGIRRIVVNTDVMKIEEVVRNVKQRCYFCKKNLFSVLKENIAGLGIDCIVHGANIDDLNDFRPGFKAALEMGIIAPLIDVGLNKEEIRFYSKEMGLETWNMPSQSCLATRIPYGQRLTVEKLVMVEKSEKVLFNLGFKGVRVRCYDSMARIEMNPQSMKLVWQKDIKDKIVKEFKKIGFLYIALDLEGYVSGNMNQSFL